MRRAEPAAPDDAQQPAQRRLPGRRRQLAPLRPPLPGQRERLPPPPAPAPQRRRRNPPAPRDRLQPNPARQSQRAHQKEQRPDIEPAPEETHRRRLHPPPANRTAQAEPPHIVAKSRRQTVRLARVGRAVKRPAAARTARRTAGLRLRRVDPLQESPDPSVRQDGVVEQLVRHWRRLWRLIVTMRQSPPGELLARSPGGTPPKTSINPSGSTPDRR